jgi:pyruvate dehydrogenase E2 component (dihydrolipoamide acetyltransferase)
MKEFVMPKLGLTMEEGTIIRWLKDEGQLFKKGEVVVEIESDKAVVEIEAPMEGRIGKILVSPNTTVPIDEVIAYLLETDEPLRDNWPIPKKPISMPQIAISGSKKGSASRELLNLTPEKSIIASPIARKLAEQKGIDITKIVGTGPGGRIIEKDILDYTIIADKGLVSQTYITPSRIKAITAERTTASFRSAPHFYLRNEVNVTQLIAFREQVLPEIETKIKVRLTYNDLLLFILSRTLKSFPLLFSQWEDGKILQNSEINIGLAMAVKDGLIVPVLKQVDKIYLPELVSERSRLVERAQAGKLRPEELKGCTFTLSNLGMFDIDEFSAIINPPQSAILAVGSIKKRVMVEDDQIIVCPSIILTLTIDHRVADGVDGAKFLSDLSSKIRDSKNFFENFHPFERQVS